MNQFENHLFYLDEERAKIVFPRLINAYKNKEGIFAQPNLFPDEILPGNLEKGSKEHALFYFYSVMGDARVKSSVNYEKFRKMYETYKEFFNPKYLAKKKLPSIRTKKINGDTLENLLKEIVGSPSPVRLSRYMIINSRTLLDGYHGNPLNIFDGIKDVGEARKKLIIEFEGYGNHLSSLLLSFYIKHDLKHFDNDNALLPKVDFHDVTLAFAFEILKPKFKDANQGIRRDQCANKLQAFLSYFAQKYNHSVFDLDNALWALGSNVCSKFDWLECWGKCPVKEYCHVKPAADQRKIKRKGKIVERSYKIYPYQESRIKNIGDLQNLFIPNFSERVLL